MANNIYIEDFSEIKKLLKENKTRRQRKSVIIHGKCKFCGRDFKKSLFFIKNESDCLCKKCIIERTCLKKYGVKSYNNREKSKRTCLEKYGVEHNSQAKSVQEKRIQTMIERFGETTNLKCEDVKRRIRKTNLERYGVENPAQNDKVREKIKRTNLERYGVEHALQNEQVKEKIKRTNEERYGADSAMKNEEIKEKVRKSVLITKKAIRNSEKNQERIRKAISDVNLLILGYELVDGEYVYNVKCNICGSEFKYSEFKSSEYYCQHPYCRECSKKGTSKQEIELYSYIKSITNFEVILHDRNILKPKELDIYVPKLNVAFEYDGLFYHNNVDNSYKFYECKKKGIRLIQINEYEWLHKKERIKSFLRNLFGYEQTRIYARKCVVKELSVDSYKKFTEENHLQGYRPSTFKFGLFHDNELVEVIGLNKIKDGYELVRECSKIDTIVVGGKSKLIKHFRKLHPGLILSYCEVSKFTGKSYLECGFVLDHISRPNYRYYSGQGEFSRIQCQKHKLKDFLGEKFDPSKTEVENMLDAGYYRIFDYGNYVFQLK